MIKHTENRNRVKVSVCVPVFSAQSGPPVFWAALFPKAGSIWASSGLYSVTWTDRHSGGRLLWFKSDIFWHLPDPEVQFWGPGLRWLRLLLLCTSCTLKETTDLIKAFTHRQKTQVISNKSYVLRSHLHWLNEADLSLWTNACPEMSI